MTEKLVLTVDDSRTIRDLLRVTLTRAGFRVVQAQDGADGLDVLERERPDLIVTDINMPVLDGYGFIERVRRTGSHRATPILVLTTEADAAQRARAREAGATGWIVKPFDPARLVDVLRRVAP